MIRKFATVSRFRVAQGLILAAVLAGAATQAQQNPPAEATPPQPQEQQPQEQQPQAQQPANQESSSSQEPSEEIGVRRRKAKEFNKWDFNIGGGGSLTRGSTKNFVRGGGGVFAAGVARNASKYLGLRLDFQYNNLPLRASALQAAGSTGGHSQVYSIALSPIINIPVGRTWGGYIIGGPAFYHRTGKLDNSTAIPGYACNPFFIWWGHCFNGNLPIHGQFLRATQNELGETFGGGITYKVRPHIEIYAEYRLMHGSHGGITTDLRPITAGIRW